MSLSELPTIDLTDIEGREATLAEIVDHACRHLTTFLVADTLLSPELILDIRTTTTQFFNLPLEDKRRLHQIGSGLGYLPQGAENLAATSGTSAPPDPKETFNIGPDPTKNRWPKDPPQFESKLLRYYREMWNISRKLMHVFSLALGMSAIYLEEQSNRGNSILRATRYPKLGTRHGETVPIRAEAHTDYGLFSLILLDEEVGGFEVNYPESGWHELRPATNRLAVNIGDLLMRLTNGAWPATLHRVTAPDPFAGLDRLTVVFLHNPNPDAVVAPLPSFQSSREEPRFDAVVAGKYLKAKSKAGLEHTHEEESL